MGGRVHVVVTRTPDGQVQDTGDCTLTAGATDFTESIYAGDFTVTAGTTTVTLSLP